MPFYIVFKHFELPTFMKCAILINLPCLTSNTLTKRLQDPIVRFGGAIALSVHLGSALFHYIREILGKQKINVFTKLPWMGWVRNYCFFKSSINILLQGLHYFALCHSPFSVLTEINYL